VIISAPPMLDVADTAVLAAEVDGVVLTTRIGSTRWTAVRQSVQALRDARALILGAAVLGQTRGAGRASPDALTVPDPATPAIDGPRPPTESRPVVRPLRRPPARPAPEAVPRQLFPARGVAAVDKAVEAPANSRRPAGRREDANDRGRWT
jgi:hypothetical protein